MGQRCQTNMDTGKAVMHDAEEKMKKSIDVLQGHFAGIRSGRANPAMLDHIKVDYYGTMTPLKQLANIAVPDPKMLSIAPWDASAVKAIEKAILESDIGIMPIVDGKSVRLSIPTLTRERREELVKIMKKVAEEGRVSMRAIRRDANERIKVLEKDKKVSEDEGFKFQTDIQKLTDQYIQKVDQSQEAKEKELNTF